MASNSGHLPYCDFDHDDRQASFWPKDFLWKDQPAPGVYVRGEWSAAGKQAIEGKTYRGFSPVFHVDNYKAKPAKVVCQPEARLNFGGLVNSPAFRNNLPLWAKQAPPDNNNTPRTPQSHPMKKTVAELQAAITTAQAALTEIQAKDTSQVEVAEELAAKTTEIANLQSELQAAERDAENAALKQELLAGRKAKAEEIVAAAVRRGAIAPKDTALQARWVKLCTEDTENIPVVNALKGNAALVAAQQSRLTINEVRVSRESNRAVLNRLGELCARNEKINDRRELAKGALDVQALYAREITPRLKEGDDIALECDNSIGTLAGTLVSMRTLELLTLSFPLLQSIATDFSDQIVSYGDTLKSRYVGIPSVVSYSTSTGWSDSDVTTVDVSMTYNRYRGVNIMLLATDIAGTIRRLFDEQAAPQAYALGKDMVDFVYGKITATAFPGVTAGNSSTGAAQATIAAGSVNFGRSNVIDLGGALDDNANPEMGRTLLLQRLYYSSLAKDSAIITMAAFSRNEIITKGTLPDVEGFNVIKAVNLPATAIGAQTLKGFGFTRSALCVASRLSADYVNVIPGAGNGLLTVVRTASGFSANQVQYVDNKLGRAYQRLEIIYAASAGQPNAGQILTDV